MYQRNYSVCADTGKGNRQISHTLGEFVLDNLYSKPPWLDTGNNSLKKSGARFVSDPDQAPSVEARS